MRDEKLRQTDSAQTERGFIRVVCVILIKGSVGDCCFVIINTGKEQSWISNQGKKEGPKGLRFTAG